MSYMLFHNITHCNFKMSHFKDVSSLNVYHPEMNSKAEQEVQNENKMFHLANAESLSLNFVE